MHLDDMFRLPSCDMFSLLKEFLCERVNDRSREIWSWILFWFILFRTFLMFGIMSVIFLMPGQFHERRGTQLEIAVKASPRPSQAQGACHKREGDWEIVCVRVYLNDCVSVPVNDCVCVLVYDCVCMIVCMIVCVCVRVSARAGEDRMLLIAVLDFH